MHLNEGGGCCGMDMVCDCAMHRYEHCFSLTTIDTGYVRSGQRRADQRDGLLHHGKRWRMNSAAGLSKVLEVLNHKQVSLARRQEATRGQTGGVWTLGLGTERVSWVAGV